MARSRGRATSGLPFHVRNGAPSSRRSFLQSGNAPESMGRLRAWAPTSLPKIAQDISFVIRLTAQLKCERSPALWATFCERGCVWPIRNNVRFRAQNQCRNSRRNCHAAGRDAQPQPRDASRVVARPPHRLNPAPPALHAAARPQSPALRTAAGLERLDRRTARFSVAGPPGSEQRPTLRRQGRARRRRCRPRGRAGQPWAIFWGRTGAGPRQGYNTWGARRWAATAVGSAAATVG
jgi:hypothetical protein